MFSKGGSESKDIGVMENVLYERGDTACRDIDAVETFQSGQDEAAAPVTRLYRICSGGNRGSKMKKRMSTLPRGQNPKRWGSRRDIL